MKILLDRAGMSHLLFCKASSEPGDHRRHYASAAPARATLVFHNGLDPASLTGAVVEAQLESEIGLAGSVRPGNEGLPHTQFTITHRVNGPPDELLSRMLAGARQDADG